MTGKRILAMLLAVFMLVSVFAACGGKNNSSASGTPSASSTGSASGESSSDKDASSTGTGEEENTPSYLNKTGLPIVNEPVTLKIMIKKDVSDLSNSYQEKECVKKAQEETGLTLDFLEISTAAWAEQIGVTLAGGDLPDVIVGSFPNFGKYLDSFLALDDLVEEYAPTVSAFYQERPELRVAGAMEDGKLYSLPRFQEHGYYTHSYRYAINQSWLDKVGKKIPTTQDELFDVMMAFKEQDANGNGDPNDEIPFSMDSQTASALDNNSYGINFLMNCCGVHSSDYVQIDDDVVSFSPTREEYRDFLEFANKLYTNGLLDVDGFVQQTADFLAKGAAGRLGIISHHSYLDIVCGADKQDQYVPMLPTKDKNGNITITGRSINGDWVSECYKISTSCQHPEAAVRLYDYVNSSDENVTLWAWGPEELVYTLDEDGVTKIRATEFEEGMTNFAQARQTYSAGMSGFWIYPKDQYNTWFKADRDLLMDEFEELYEPYLCTYMPMGTDKQEVVERRNDQFAEINTYIQNFTAESIMKGIDDAGWQQHLDTCERLNVSQYVEDYQNFYDDKKVS